MILLVAQLASAATWQVPEQVPTLGAAVLAAGNMDTIEVDAQWYLTELGSVTIREDLTIRGVNGRPALPAISIENATVSFEEVQLVGRLVLDNVGNSLSIASSDVTLTGVRFTRQDSRAVLAWDSRLVLDSVSIDDREGTQRAISLADSWMVVSNSTMSHNAGGAIHALNSLVELDGVDFASNAAPAGDGGSNGGGDVHIWGGTLFVQGGSSTSSTAVDDGGSIYALDASVHIDGTQFVGNASTGGAGGAIAAVSTLDNTILPGIGLTIANASFQSTGAPQGGAIYAQGRTATRLSDTTFSNVWTTVLGGAAVSQVNGWFEGERLDVTGFSDSRAAFVFNGTQANFGQLDVDGLASTNGLTGGIIEIDNGDLTLDGSVLFNTNSEYGSGGVKASSSSTQISNTSFDLIRGFSAAIKGEFGTLEVESTTLTQVYAQNGGAIYSASQSVRLEDLRVQDATGTAGAGAIELDGPLELDLLRSDICASTPAAGAITVRGDLGTLGPARIAATTVHKTAGGIAAIARTSQNTDRGVLELSHLTLVDNATAGVRAEAAVSLTHSLLVGHEVALSGAALSATNNLYWDNASQTADGANIGSNALEVDPLFVGRTGGCDADLALQSDSPALGPPALGATGGPDASPVDRDGDGWPSTSDCDDFDPWVHPLADDPPGDGLDADCDGLDGDLDGDGFFAPDDCDDADPTVFPGADDPPNDDRDGNCNGAVSTSSVGGRSCSHDVGSGLPLGWMALTALLTRRRRR